MSKPDWWYHARQIAKKYPELHRQLEMLRSQNVTPHMDGMPSGGEISRSTERAALRELPNKTDRADYGAVDKAIRITKQYPNSDRRMQIIDLLIWRNSHTVDGAAMVTHYSRDAVKDFHAAFLTLVAVNRDFVNIWELSNKFYKNYPKLLDKCPEFRERCVEFFSGDGDVSDYPAFLKKYPEFAKEYVKSH